MDLTLRPILDIDFMTLVVGFALGLVASSLSTREANEAALLVRVELHSNAWPPCPSSSIAAADDSDAAAALAACPTEACFVLRIEFAAPAARLSSSRRRRKEVLIASSYILVRWARRIEIEKFDSILFQLWMEGALSLGKKW